MRDTQLDKGKSYLCVCISVCVHVFVVGGRKKEVYVRHRRSYA